MARKTTDFTNPSNLSKTNALSKSRDFLHETNSPIPLKTDKLTSALSSNSKATKPPATTPPGKTNPDAPGSKLSIVPQLEPETCPFQELIDE